MSADPYGVFNGIENSVETIIRSVTSSRVLDFTANSFGISISSGLKPIGELLSCNTTTYLRVEDESLSLMDEKIKITPTEIVMGLLGTDLIKLVSPGEIESDLSVSILGGAIACVNDNENHKNVTIGNGEDINVDLYLDTVKQPAIIYAGHCVGTTITPIEQGRVVNASATVKNSNTEISMVFTGSNLDKTNCFVRIHPQGSENSSSMCRINSVSIGKSNVNITLIGTTVDCVIEVVRYF